MQRLNLVVDDLSRFDLDSLHPQPFANRPVRSVTDKLALLEKLVTTQELQPLLSIFAGEINKSLPVSGMVYHDGRQQLHLKYSSHSQHTFESILNHQGTPLGKFTYDSQKPLSERQRQIIASMEQQLLQPLANARMFEHNKNLAMRDVLTGLGNRCYFDDSYARMLATATRDKRSFSVLVIDLDHFKRVNDTCGHAVGDQVLVAFAELLKNSLRTNDLSFRLGGDEFVLLLSHDKKQQPERVAERIQEAIKEHTMLSDYGISCSLGSADWRPSDTGESLFNRADQAMYSAKRKGRNSYVRA